MNYARLIFGFLIGICVLSAVISDQNPTLDLLFAVPIVAMWGFSEYRYRHRPQ